MVGELPAGLEPQDSQGAALFGFEVLEGGVGDVVSLQRELVEAREQFDDGADGFVCHVDAVGQRERYYFR